MTQQNFRIPVIGEGGKLVEYLSFNSTQLQERGLTKDSTLYAIPVTMQDGTTQTIITHKDHKLPGRIF